VLSRFLQVTPTGNRYLGRPRRRWEKNIRIDLNEIGITTMICVDSAQDIDYCEPL
jgi:hypothetical protein